MKMQANQCSFRNLMIKKANHVKTIIYAEWVSGHCNQYVHECIHLCGPGHECAPSLEGTRQFLLCVLLIFENHQTMTDFNFEKTERKNEMKSLVKATSTAEMIKRITS